MCFNGKIIGLLCLAATVCFFAPAARADDSMAALGAGGIELLQSEHIVMEEQDLFLARDRVRTRFVFRNESDTDIKTLVAFVMPDMEPEAFAKRADTPLLEQLGFTVEADGRKVIPKADIRAIMAGEDVTDILASIGIAAGAGGMHMEAFTPAQRDRLRKEGLLLESRGRDDLGGWSTRLRLYWEQVFPARGQVEIYHEYTPFLGSEIIFPETIARVPYFTESFCMTEAQKEKAVALLQTADGRAYDLDYTLSTGANWKGPVERLAITIEKKTADDVIATCLPGLKPQKQGAYGVSHTNVKPAEDIRVLFISKE